MSASAHPTDTTLHIEGMTCQGCVQSVTRVLQGLPGVESVTVSLERHAAELRYDPQRVTPEAMRTAVEGAGFEVR
jgi:copper chaperone CopZ